MDCDRSRDGTLPYLRPDGKSQVTVEYHDGRPARLDAVVISTQHLDTTDIESLRRAASAARWAC